MGYGIATIGISRRIGIRRSIENGFPSTLTDGTCLMRQVVRGDYLCTDVTLTALGFAGVEDTDWVCESTILCNYLYDGNTVAWYKSSDLTTITKDVNNLVERWNDKLGTGRDLIQADSSKQPVWSSNGILFDGVDNYLKTAAFTLNQPTYIFIVFRQITWTVNDQIIEGTVNGATYIRQTNATPRVAAYSGTQSAVSNNVSLPLDSFGIIRLYFNGANSSIQVNNNIKTIGDFGSANMGGVTLGSRADGAGLFSNIEVKELIIRNTDIFNDEIYLSLYKKYGLGGTPFDNGKVAFTFDDNIASIETLGIPLFAAKGIVGSIYMPTDAPWVDWSAATALNNAGWELANHSKAHIDYTTLSEAQIRTDIETSQAAFVTNSLPEPISHGVPYGITNDSVQAILPDYFVSARGFLSPDIGYANDGKYTIKGIQADQNYFTLAQMKDVIDHAYAFKGSAIFVFHNIFNDTGAVNGIDVSSLTELIDYAQSKNLDILKISELASLVS